MAEKVFPKGIFVKEPNEKAPDFVGNTISIKREELIQWLQSQEEDWINLKTMTSKAGKPYLEVDTWKPDIKAEAEKERVVFDSTGDDLPF